MKLDTKWKRELTTEKELNFYKSHSKYSKRDITLASTNTWLVCKSSSSGDIMAIADISLNNRLLLIKNMWIEDKNLEDILFEHIILSAKIR
jgi:hypothetical protein